MQSRIFQNACNQLKKDIHRRLGIMDENGYIIACSDESKVGFQKEAVVTHFDISNDDYMGGGYIFRKIETYSKNTYVVFCEGEDEIAKGFVSFLAAHFTTIKQYYDEKYDRNSFIKNIILDNILPSDVLYKARELKLAIECPRIVILVRSQKAIETSLVDVLQSLFPDSAKDFVIRIDDRDVAVVHEIKPGATMQEILHSTQELHDTITSEIMIKVSVGISTIVDTIPELARAYREARIALEVGKVFDTEKNIISYDNLGIGRLIYQLPTTLCELFLNEVFKKESISVLDSETIYTIQKFFENNLNVSETSRKLFVHRNTLVYRLDKIKKLTGLDLREFDDAIIFKVAMMVNKYLTSEPTRL
ncbi:MAG: helix-turn-helix domain-containing protein [Clostridia bacterium]|nr:helix-turn-helix domain-containing protein [Clostridia bacterium]